MLPACLPFGVSTGGRWSGFRGFRTSLNASCGPLVLLLSALLLCLRCVALECALISRFKGVFRGFYGCCVGLCCLGALRGLWGFCARVELGGLKTFCVFASIFPILCLRFIRFSSSSPIFWGFVFVVLGLSSCLPCLFLCPCGSLCFLFPLRMYRQKERAQFPCVLSCPVVGLFISP